MPWFLCSKVDAYSDAGVDNFDVDIDIKVDIDVDVDVH